ncbi:hypothetical protein LCGC14_1053810 [marine sediment metagenome]|uniref:Uncharacterized protein n=1 Tax=marine sediment metagenome TaxID=412755 RepID=A0A0F9Q657_9ZZZZ
MSVINNEVQFVTLDFVKAHFIITDDQDDDILFGIVQAANMEMKKRLTGFADDIGNLAASQFWPSIQSAGLVFVEAEIRRQINQLYTEAETIMSRFENMMVSLIGELKSVAPTRTERIIAKRDEDFEDDFFAERRFV